ncbi:MAG: hypothetical protein R3C49_24450 [Planctomycetaceae bacterium]
MVTFENVVTDGPTDEPSDVKVSVETLSVPEPPPHSYVAELPNGRSVELVGITKNTRPAA